MMKNYISREFLIESILNEDVALGAPTHPKKRSTFVTDANDKDSSTEGARASKGGQSKKALQGSQLIFRKPTKAEIIAAEEKFDFTVGSDYQMPQILILSQVLFDFDVLPKVYRSKTDDWNYGKTNAVEVDKALDNLRRLFHKSKYSPDTPIEQLVDDMQHSTSEVEAEVGVRLPSLLKLFTSWKEILTMNPALKSEKFPRGYNELLMKGIEELGAADPEESYKKVNEFLLDNASKGEHKNPKEFAKYMERCETISAVLNEPLIKPYVNRALSTTGVNDFEEFVLFVTTNLKKNRVERQKGNTMTIMQHKAMEAIRHFDLIMKKNGYEDGIRNFQEMIDFIQERRPETFQHICYVYGLDEESIKEFTSYADFCDFLFGDPDNLYKLYKRTAVETRSRTKGETRKGGAGVRFRDFAKKEKTILKSMDDAMKGKRGPRGATKEEVEKKMEDIAAAVAELEEDMKNLDKDSPEYEEKKALRFAAKKRYAQYAHKLRTMPDDAGTRETLEDKLAKNRKQMEDIVDKSYKRLKDDEIDDFNQKFNVDKQRYDSGAYDIGSGYVTMAFTMKISPEKYEVVDYIVDYIDKYFNKKELAAGKEDVINVDYEEGRYNAGMRTYPCTRFVVDYPETSDLYKTMKSFKDKSERSSVLAELLKNLLPAIEKQFGIYPELVTGDKDHKIKLMAKQESSYSFRD